MFNFVSCSVELLPHILLVLHKVENKRYLLNFLIGIVVDIPGPGNSLPTFDNPCYLLYVVSLQEENVEEVIDCHQNIPHHASRNEIPKVSEIGQSRVTLHKFQIGFLLDYQRRFLTF